ncbi:uncharacterized protein LOC121736152 isoform X2 [Aricia agestis]|uniref:uncharacterized protein LOC121736152 isoform X2 n=1 Tax=Aricia agestis TaxID=91739 RepID=UPI001C20746A|nr:uncharacterized protein LOC121736152 isoform X2 [Aricia agestis]
MRNPFRDAANKYKNCSNCDEHRIELTPLHIDASVADIILINVPEIYNPTIYYLTDPDGDTVPLDITSKTTRIEEIKISELETKYKILDINFDDCINEVCNKTEGVDDDEFIIGPLSEYDHGNWVLSAYVKGNEGWMEIYQVITIQITVHMPINPTKPKLNRGETFELSLAYPIEDLESCEIVAPRTTFDRSFDRSRSNQDSCGFIISNITKADEGVWKIIAVGRVVYQSTVFLEVNDVF